MNQPILQKITNPVKPDKKTNKEKKRDLYNKYQSSSFDRLQMTKIGKPFNGCQKSSQNLELCHFRGILSLSKETRQSKKYGGDCFRGTGTVPPRNDNPIGILCHFDNASDLQNKYFRHVYFFFQLKYNYTSLLKI